MARPDLPGRVCPLGALEQAAREVVALWREVAHTDATKRFRPHAVTRRFHHPRALAR